MASGFKLGGQSVRRRVMLGGLTGVAATACDRAVEKAPEGRVEDALSELRAALAALHGSAWTAHVDHENGFILIRSLEALERLS